MNTKDRKENQFVLIEFSEEQQAFNFNLDGADKTAPSYMPIVWLPHLDAVRWTQEMKNLRADHRLTLEEVVERSMTPLVKRGIRKDREAVRRHREDSKQQTRLRQLQRRKAILTKKLAEVEEEIKGILEESADTRSSEGS